MLELLLSNVKGKDLSELIASGKEMMASSLSGCGGGGVGGGAVEVKIAEKVEEKKEEKVAEEDEEFDDVSLYASSSVFLFTSNLVFFFCILTHSCY